jgi:CheY-like chemotaxis protein
MFSAVRDAHTAVIANQHKQMTPMQLSATRRNPAFLPAEHAPTPVATRYNGGDNVKIFVVEDSAPVRERLVELITELEGCEVIGEAATCQAALNGVRRTRPDVAIFDIQLADGSGIEALARLRREQPQLRGIVLTNYATPQHQKASFQAGAEYFLDKSADFERIADILHRMKAGKSGASI